MPTKPPPSRTKRSTAPLRGGEPGVEAKTTARAPRSASGVSWAIRSTTITRRPRSERRKACSAGIEAWWKPAVSETTSTAGGGASAYIGGTPPTLRAVRRLARMAAVASEFPLFPLPLVALPSEQVPLHIFEDRYKALIGQCLEDGREFGIVWLSDEELKGTGCAVQVDRVLERFDDGRLYIVCVGTRPFRLVAGHEDLLYPSGAVEFLDDRTENADAATAERARESYGALVERATDRRPEPAEL